jgi:tetratricopeptide (TPR) repeat protein
VSGKAEQASSELMQAVGADRARIDPAGPKPAAAGEEDDPFQVFKTPAERNTAALSGYRKARSARTDSGTALLARLGEAGVLLDQRSFDEALAAYREVKASQLAAADPDVRGRCIEGIGFALEAKGDADGAVKAYKELSMYHQARLLAAKGDKEQALKLTKDARERLQTTGEARNASYLSGVLEELQRKIDPSSMPKRSLGGPGGQASLDELQKLQQQVLQEVEKAQKKGGHQDEH